MVLRFFAYVLASITGTILVVVTLVATLDLAPPEAARAEATLPLATEILRRAYANGQEQAVRATFAGYEALGKLYQIRVAAGGAPECSSANDIGRIPSGGCLRLEPATSTTFVNSRIKPFLVPFLAGLIVSVAVAVLLSRKFGVPIRIIGDGLSDLASGRLDRRVTGDLSRADRAFVQLGGRFDAAATYLETLHLNRERLLHDISHEIRSPLARLQVAIGLLRISPGRREDIVDRMDRDIDRMDDLIGGVLAFSRIEHSPFDMTTLQPTDLVDILDPIIADANFEGAPRSVECIYEGPLTATMRGSVELLQRAFENVVRNAVRLTREGSVVSVSVETTDDTINVSIADRGPGVREDELEKMFEPFRRGDNADEHTGAGLGLAIARRAVKAHGGEIFAVNRSGGGLEIRVNLRK